MDPSWQRLRVRAHTAAAAFVTLAVITACGGKPAGSSAAALRASDDVPPAAAAVSATGPARGSSQPVASSSTTEVPAMALTLTSPSFADGATIPRQFTCDGRDASPPLQWSGAPAGTRAFAIVMTDPDARGFVHWIATDIAGTLSGLPEGASGTRAAGIEGANTFGRTGWSGPCPPARHHYVFELFALSEPLGLHGTPTLDQVRAALAGRTLGTATLSGQYQRG
jgi:Raf kinase inhibitor-like YbhB/YbcL family protein